jgi:hypothetical protein
MNGWTASLSLMQDNADLVQHKPRNFARQNKDSGIWGNIFKGPTKAFEKFDLDDPTFPFLGIFFIPFFLKRQLAKQNLK